MKSHGSGLYGLLLALQTFGIGIILVNGVPFYRQMALDFTKFKPNPEPLWWAMAAVVLIQIAYWVCYRLKPALPQKRSIVVGHIVGFMARIIFVFATASFPIIFFQRFETFRDAGISPLRFMLILLVYFSMFCWTLELERLASVLNKPKQ